MLIVRRAILAMVVLLAFHIFGLGALALGQAGAWR